MRLEILNLKNDTGAYCRLNRPNLRYCHFYYVSESLLLVFMALMPSKKKIQILLSKD